MMPDKLDLINHHPFFTDNYFDENGDLLKIEN